MRKSSLPKLLAILALCLSLLFSIGAPSELAYNNLNKVSYTPFTVYPVVSPRKSSDFGWRIHPVRRFSAKHLGIDLAAPTGTPIRAVANGQVIFSDPYAGYGNLIVIKHANGLTTHYGHCDTLKVSIGTKVNAGQIIALIGSTGVSTGPHLHFEVRVNGQAQDPELFMPYLASQAQG